MLLSRRDMLRLAAAGTAAIAAPPLLAPRRLSAVEVPWSTPHGFLIAEEMAILDAATARIVPTDDAPGARECGVIDYIQSLLSFMPGSDANCDRHVNATDLTATLMQLGGEAARCSGAGDVDGDAQVDASDVIRAEAAVFHARPVHAGGPFSGRQPQPHFPTGSTPCQVCHPQAAQPIASNGGAASSTVDNYPPDFFLEHLPLPRVRALSWKIRILGADAVPEAAQNPLASELIETDMRHKYRDGLAALEAKSQQVFGKSFLQLTPQEQSTVLDRSDARFLTLMTYHTVEGMLCAPEYGGNRDRLGWQLVGFDGDSQPLGYTIYDDTSPNGYRERPDKPNSGPNPDEDCRGFSAAVGAFLSIISSAELVAPGGPFPNPYCFEVEK